MLRLAFLIYAIAGTTVAGSFFVIALVLGYDTGRPIILAVGSGALFALPISLWLAKTLDRLS